MMTCAEDAIRGEKAELRRAVMAERDKISSIERAVATNAARARILSLVLRTEGAVSGFMPIRSEIDITPVLEDLMKGGRTVSLPAIVSKTEIVFRRLDGSASLVDAGYGTRAPGPDAAVVDPAVLLVPLVAFDRRGGRLGYGGGFYDRALATRDADGKVLAIGVAFARQERDLLPAHTHDRPLDYVITERETIPCRDVPA